MIKRIALIAALVLALSPLGATYAQIAAFIVTNVTFDATMRASAEAVHSATQKALNSGKKTEAIKTGNIKAPAKKTGRR